MLTGSVPSLATSRPAAKLSYILLRFSWSRWPHFLPWCSGATFATFARIDIFLSVSSHESLGMPMPTMDSSPIFVCTPPKAIALFRRSASCDHLIVSHVQTHLTSTMTGKNQPLGGCLPLGPWAGCVDAHGSTMMWCPDNLMAGRPHRIHQLSGKAMPPPPPYHTSLHRRSCSSA